MSSSAGQQPQVKQRRGRKGGMGVKSGKSLPSLVQSCNQNSPGSRNQGEKNLLWSSRGDFGSVGERQSEVTPARAAPREVPGGWRRDPAASSVPDPSRLSPGGSRGAWLSCARAARLIFSSVPSLAPAPTSSPRSASRPPPQHALCKRCGTIWG